MEKPTMTHFCFVRPDAFSVGSAYGRLQVRNTVAHYRAAWAEAAGREIKVADDVGDEDLERARLEDRQEQFQSQSQARHYMSLCDTWDALLKKHANPAEDAEIEAVFAT
jgi:hypothetical protein